MKSLEAAKNLPIDTTAVNFSLIGNFFGLEVILIICNIGLLANRFLGGLLASSLPTCAGPPLSLFWGLICTCSCRSTAVPRDSGSISAQMHPAWPSSGSTAVSTWTQMSSPSDPSLRTTFWLHRNLSSQVMGCLDSSLTTLSCGSAWKTLWKITIHIFGATRVPN